MTTGGECLEQVALANKVNRSEVFHELGTTRDVQVSIIRHGIILEHRTLPVHIRIALALLHGGLVTIVLDKAQRLHVSKTLRIEVQLMLYSHVTSHHGIVRVILVGQHRRDLHDGIGCHTNLCLTLSTTLGGNQDHTISTLHTINGSSRGILQD